VTVIVGVNVTVAVAVTVGVVVIVQFATVVVTVFEVWFAWPPTKSVAKFENEPVLQLMLFASVTIWIVAVCPAGTEPSPHTTVSLPLFGVPVEPQVMTFVAVALTNWTCAGRTSVIALGLSVNAFGLLFVMLSV
jgi:hypothetical protein